MRKKKQVIYSADWLAIHPYKTSATDLYYVKLSNRIFDAIEAVLDNTPFENDILALTEDEKKRLSCTLTAYFEDVISQTNIFVAFRTENKKRTGKPIPFFDCSDYEEDEINTQDIQFLIWHYYMQLNGTEIPFSPLNPLFSEMAKSVMTILDEEYETAPENKKLQEFFNIPDDIKQNIQALHTYIFWLGTESYLFQENGIFLQTDAEEIAEIAKNDNMEEQIPDMINMMCNDFTYNHVTEFYTLRPSQWLARVLGKDNCLYQPLNELSRKYSGYFKYESENSTHTKFIHIATGKEIDIVNRSLHGFPKDMKDKELVLFIGFVRWMDEWWFIGQVRSYNQSNEIKKEVDNEEELHLFDDSYEPTEKEQTALFNKIMSIMAEDGPDYTDEDRAWGTMMNRDISKNFIKKAFEEGHLPKLNFEGETNNQLMKDNLNFILDYMKR